MAKVLEKLETAEFRSRRSLSYDEIRAVRKENLIWKSTVNSPTRPIREVERDWLRQDEARQAPSPQRFPLNDEWVRTQRPRETEEREERSVERIRKRSASEVGMKKDAGERPGSRTNTKTIETSPQTPRTLRSGVTKEEHPVRLVAYQTTGLFTSFPTIKLPFVGDEVSMNPMHIAQEELVQTLEERRKHKKLSVQTQYSRLIPPFQRFMDLWIRDLHQRTGVEWTIASIGLQKVRSVIGRRRYEQIQVILQGRYPEPKVCLSLPTAPADQR